MDAVLSAVVVLGIWLLAGLVLGPLIGLFLEANTNRRTAPVREAQSTEDVSPAA